MIIVPAKTPGVTLSPKLDKMGMRSSDTAQVFFDNVRVPQRNRVGAEGAGFMMQMMQFQEERMYAAANAIGGAEVVINATIEYCRQRTAFGKPLLDNQVIHFRMAELMRMWSRYARSPIKRVRRISGAKTSRVWHRWRS